MDVHVQLDSDASSADMSDAGGIGRSFNNERESFALGFSWQPNESCSGTVLIRELDGVSGS